MLNEYQERILESLKKAGFILGSFETISGKPKPHKLLSESGKRILDFIGRTCDENSPFSDLIAEDANRIANILANNTNALAKDYGIDNYADILSGKQSEGSDMLHELIEELFSWSRDDLRYIDNCGL